MTDNIILRRFEKTDVPDIHKIYSYYVNNSVVTFDIDAPSEKAIEKKYFDIAKKDHPIIIAQVDNEVVGFAYASNFRPRPAYRFTCENAIYIDNNMVGRGIGDLLLAELLKQAKDFGFNQMIAIVTASANSSIKLHKKHGFEILGEFPELGYKFDKWHSIIHMQRKL